VRFWKKMETSNLILLKYLKYLLMTVYLQTSLK